MKRFVLAALALAGFASLAPACSLSASFVGQAAYCPTPVALALPQVQYAAPVQLQLPQVEALPAAPYCPSVGLSAQSYAQARAVLRSSVHPEFIGELEARNFGADLIPVARRGVARRAVRRGVRGAAGLGLLGFGALGLAPAITTVDPLELLALKSRGFGGRAFSGGRRGGRRR